MSSPYIGIAGWSYPHWNGVVYPKLQSPGSHPLELVSKHLDLVEINSSFYQFLKPELVKLWIKKVSDRPGFLFTAKLHQRFTHARMLEDSEIAEFKRGVWPLLEVEAARRFVNAIPLVLPFHGGESGILHPPAPGFSRVSARR